MNFWARLHEFFVPSRARLREARLREGIRWLMDHPEMPVYFADHGDGYATTVTRL